MVPTGTALTQKITLDQAWFYRIVPCHDHEGMLCLATDQVSSSDLINELHTVLGHSVQLIKKEKIEIDQLLIKHYPRVVEGHHASNGNRQAFSTHDAGSIENLIAEAKDLGSSDIHIEIFAARGRIRFRLDGKLVERHVIQIRDYPSLLNKVKIAAGCDIAEKRLPQDGRIRCELKSQSLDVRVSILPTHYGEKAVLRILGTNASRLSLQTLGFGEQDYQIYLRAIKKPHGIVFVSGPTGSGKTTTLYATLNGLNSPANNIVTIEDPIEYTLDGVNQVQVKDDIGFGFPEALRTFLRQDPDIIMVGEVRDPVSAQLAVRAALTGHLVFSTIHTNSAWGTITRLIDIGIPPYVLSNVLNISIAQRLIRLLCTSCKVAADLDKASVPERHRQAFNGNHFLAGGCQICFYTGFKGRKAIYEVLEVDDQVQNLIRQGSSGEDNRLPSKQFRRLVDSAIDLVNNGETTIEEIFTFLVSEN